MLNEEETTNIIPSYLARRNWTQQQSSPWPCCGIKQADYFSWLECRRVDLKRLHVSIARHQCFFCARHMFSCRPTVHWRKNTLFRPVFQNALVVKAAGINWLGRIQAGQCPMLSFQHRALGCILFGLWRFILAAPCRARWGGELLLRTFALALLNAQEKSTHTCLG